MADEMTWVQKMRAELNSTPEGRKALADAEEREKHLVERPCSAGNCIDLIDERTGENTGGWGPVGCPCQDEPGRMTALACRIRDHIRAWLDPDDLHDTEENDE